MMRDFEVMGISCAPFADQREAVDYLKSLVRRGDTGYTVAINAEKIVRCSGDATFRSLVQAALIKVPDGAGAVLALRILHGVRSAKVDFPQSTLMAANELGIDCRLAVIGASEESHCAAVAEIGRRYPLAKIVMHRSGFTPEESLLQELLRARPQLCLVAMGTPKQEIFAMRAINAGVPCIFVGAGGALDILSGRTVRAPKWMVDNYLEWLYRLWKQPTRLRRQLVLPVFMGRLVAAAVSERLAARRAQH